MLRFILTADWHLRATRPRCRIDEDWYATQRNAVNQVKNIALEKKCDVAIVGDIFNSNADTSFQCIQIIQDFAKELKDNNLSLYILAGNHDLPYHSSENIEKSAVGILFNSDNIFPIQDLDKTGKEISAGNFDEKDNQDAEIVFKHILTIPEEDKNPVIDCETPESLVKKFPNAKYIFTGDYHKNFCKKIKNTYVINPGCLLRQASDMKDYQCGVYFVDTEKEVAQFIPIIDKEQFVDDSYILKQEERESRIESFVDKLKDTKNVSLDFLDNVKKAMQANKLSEEMVLMLEELLEV